MQCQIRRDLRARSVPLPPLLTPGDVASTSHFPTDNTPVSDFWSEYPMGNGLIPRGLLCGLYQG